MAVASAYTKSTQPRYQLAMIPKYQNLIFSYAQRVLLNVIDLALTLKSLKKKYLVGVGHNS